MDYQFLKYETDERIATIIFNNPARCNAFSSIMRKEFRTAIAKAIDDEDIRVIIVAGAGGKAFSSGYDLNEAVDIDDLSIMDWRKRIADHFDFAHTVWVCSKPVIAQIEGYCLAGAFEFAQMCDIRYCSEDSKFGAVESRFAGGVTTLAMPWIIGARCRELIYTGDTIGANEAKEMGLVNRVFPKDQLRVETMKAAKRISLVAMACLQWNKRAINQTYDIMGFRAATTYGMEACLLLTAMDPPEYKEFNLLRREKGVKEAVNWRDSQFKKYE
ncbi:enoyl-CoA hydratase/isomerase family protein [Bradyrhizobium sp. CB82]|uniref:enoyl-CoA hydratase/isomerase family protein n=1 Tax=Bradyrhizobium sp. CB82 TaxID=3039159 RepID=UPI0024B273E7|nr:enoyl-CoA hydratase/isomerase family protein [Bradyrhizobium sp. CB82]WFU40044.1 enoyl-CoA hydratase/isomerase family protein [Bradyrhizobium sp. CB82]